MKKSIVFIFCCLSMFLSFGQENNADIGSEKVLDSLYREDQFYVGVTYNLLLNRPEGISQSGFSGGLHVGFIRDMPINKKRNVAIGIGVGYSLNVYNHNLFIDKEEGTQNTIFNSLEDVDFSTNRFATHIVEAPFEFRWRTSVPETHKFYRIYTGFKLGYLFSFNSNFKDPESRIKQTTINELDRLRMGITFTFGWNTFNFHFYYSLTPLFTDEALLGQETVGLRPAKVGLTFYIL
ncbi:porin family protein [Aquimarina mytili]|uniref:PorT family protein n=1 Tax=Aquimarina mytili TaxID=874423 RepID=A0A937A2F4_9FLAO|nr:porin family protein [Aquimarina mytili]MBL0683750.1 PorT family protein [Aquimarina mytili]